MTYRFTRQRTTIAVAVLASAVSPALADIGAPMIMVTLPGGVLVLLPVVLVETVILAKDLALPRLRALKAVSLANLVSTLVGIPVAWLAMLFVEFASRGVFDAAGRDIDDSTVLSTILGAAWLPYDPVPTSMLFGSCLVLMVPAFFASWLLEYHVIYRCLRPREGFAVLSAARIVVPIAEQVAESPIAPNALSRSVMRANIASYIGLVVLIAGWWAIVSWFP